MLNIISTEEHSLFPALHISVYPGLYKGIPPSVSLPPKRHFWGLADPPYQIGRNRVAVLESNRSGAPDEWTVSVEILVDGEKVIWKNFRHEQLDLYYENIPDYFFELVEYKKAMYEELGIKPR